MPAIHVEGESVPNPKQITNCVVLEIQSELFLNDEVYVLLRKSDLLKHKLISNTHLFAYSFPSSEIV